MLWIRETKFSERLYTGPFGGSEAQQVAILLPNPSHRQDWDGHTAHGFSFFPLSSPNLYLIVTCFILDLGSWIWHHRKGGNKEIRCCVCRNIVTYLYTYFLTSPFNLLYNILTSHIIVSKSFYTVNLCHSLKTTIDVYLYSGNICKKYSEASRKTRYLIFLKILSNKSFVSREIKMFFKVIAKKAFIWVN